MKRVTLMMAMIVSSLLVFGQTHMLEPQDQAKMEKEQQRELQKKKMVGTKGIAKNIEAAPLYDYGASKAGGLQVQKGDNISVLVASPNADDFTEHALPLLNEYDGVSYTVTSDLGSLTVDGLLDYDVVWTYNVSMWDAETGTTGEAWSNVLGDFIEAGGFLVESQFVNGYDDWGLLSGNYIDNNLSPFHMSTLDRPSNTFNLGDVAEPSHPIMAGVNTLSTDYFVQDVTVRDDALLLASWGNAEADPLVAVYDNIVAFNACPTMSAGSGVTLPGITGDGYKMFHNAIVWLFYNQADPESPAAVADLTVTPGAEGELTAELSWTNPEEDVAGDILTELDDVYVYRNGELIYTLENPVIGDAATYTDDDITEAGNYAYTVQAENSFGEGLAASASTWVGEDVPAAVDNLLLAAQDNDGHLSWDAPTEGLSGGYYDPASLIAYTIIRNPDEAEFTVDASETEFLDDELPGIGFYSYTVIPVSTIGEGGVAVSNEALLAAEGAIFMHSGEVTTCEGTFFDSGGPDEDYSNNEEHVLTFFPEDENAKMRFQFVEYNTEDNYDFLFVYNSDQVEEENLVGQFSGTSVPDELVDLISTHPTGAITFRFFSDGSVTRPGWQADVSCFIPADDDLAGQSITGNPTPTVGEETIYTVTVQNMGSESQVGTDYTVELRDENDNVLATADGADVDADESADIQLSWTPTQQGPMEIYGYVDLAVDGNPDNNATPVLSLNVQPEGIFAVTVGDDPVIPGFRSPFDFWYQNSLAQTIYYPEELQLSGGVITGVTYYSDFANDLQDQQVRIYAGITDKEDLEEGFVDDEIFTLVFEGGIDVPSGDASTFIPFDEPFIYTGGNLVLMTNKTMYDYDGGSGDRFYHTETPDKPARQLTAMSDSEEYNPLNPPASGTTRDYVPNTTLFFNTDGLGALEGTVTDGTDGLEDVQVSILGSSITATTDADGAYEFPALLPDVYNVEFSKFGYDSYVAEGVVIEEDETTVTDAVLTPIEHFTVTGIVESNGGEVLEDATVTLQGYDEYVAHTDADGAFTLADVYEGSYDVTVVAEGHQVYTEENILIEDDTDLGVITLDIIILVPGGLTVDVDGQDEGNALFSWTLGELEEFRYDNGVVDAQLGFDGDLNSVMGSVHHRNAEIHEVSWFLTDEAGPYPTVKLWILGLNDDGTPDRNNVLYENSAVANQHGEWNIYELSQPVEAEGFFIGLSADGFLALAVDDGQDDEWAFVPGTQFGVFDITDDASLFTDIAEWEFEVNYLLRGYGYDYGPARSRGSTIAQNQASGPAPNIGGPVQSYYAGQPEYTADAGRDNSADVKFNVFLNEQEVASEISDQQYLFTELSSGTYTAGVQSVYASGTSEIVSTAFTIEVEDPDPVYPVTFTVTDQTESFQALRIKGEMTEPQWADIDLVEDPDHVWSITLDVEPGTYQWGITEDDGSEDGDWLLPADTNLAFTVDQDGDVSGDTGYTILEVNVDNISAESFHIYPNPAREVLHISTASVVEQVRILDVSGRVVFTDQVNSTPYKVDTSGLDNGVYIVQIITEDGISTEKVQIQN